MKAKRTQRGSSRGSAVTATLLLVAVSNSGCAGYFARRLDDACDIFTATAEVKSVGFKAQMGPWGGLGVYGSDSDAFGVGFIGGQRTRYDFTDVTMPPFVGFVQKFRNFEDDRRRKEFHVVQSWGVPYLRPQTNPSGFSGGFKEAGDWRRVAPRYTQVEIAIGFWGGIRLGMNFGELIDFLVGWTTLDVFGDDVPSAPEEWETPIETPVTELGSDVELEPELEPVPETEGDSRRDTEPESGSNNEWESNWESGTDTDWDTEIDVDPSES